MKLFQCFWSNRNSEHEKCDKNLWQIQRKRFQISSKIVLQPNLQAVLISSDKILGNLQCFCNLDSIFEMKICSLCLRTSNFFQWYDEVQDILLKSPCWWNCNQTCTSVFWNSITTQPPLLKVWKWIDPLLTSQNMRNNKTHSL